MTPTANTAYRGLLDTVYVGGAEIAPRGFKTREILGYQTCIDMRYPIVTIPSRKLNYRFMAAEAYWILTGQQGLDELTPYCKNMAKFSDDNLTLSGAYGPRFISQSRYIVDALVSDNSTRQAVLTIWERNPRPSKDIPCTVSLQWLLRNNKLHCIAHMRSQDVWLGWPYDVFSFTMMTCYIIALARSQGYVLDWELGNLRVMVGSQHLYDQDSRSAIDVITSKYEDDGVILGISSLRCNTPGDILMCLGNARNADNTLVLTQIQHALCQ